jgi:TATA-box binding protein (TBP) (component of TFIID and TFIIIB)
LLIKNISVKNIVGTFRLSPPPDCFLDVVKQWASKKRFVIYEPELFINAKFRINNVSVLLFPTGRVIITGASTINELKRTRNVFIRFLKSEVYFTGTVLELLPPLHRKEKMSGSSNTFKRPNPSTAAKPQSGPNPAKKSKESVGLPPIPNSVLPEDFPQTLDYDFFDTMMNSDRNKTPPPPPPSSPIHDEEETSPAPVKKAGKSKRQPRRSKKVVKTTDASPNTKGCVYYSGMLSCGGCKDQLEEILPTLHKHHN